MSLLPNLPGTKFAQYLQQEHKKHEQREKDGKSNKYVGIFQDIESQETEEKQFTPPLRSEVVKRVYDQIGAGTKFLSKLVFKGVLDARVTQAYPGPAKEGSFWIIEYAGQIGSKKVEVGDILLRFNQFASDWILIVNDMFDKAEAQPSSFMNPTEELEHAKAVSEKALQNLKSTLNRPKTKAAPGPQKRKVILEDE